MSYPHPTTEQVEKARQTSPVTSEVDYDDLPDISISFDRETIRRTLGKVGEDMVREYLNYCLQQEDVFSNWLEIYNQSKLITQATKFRAKK